MSLPFLVGADPDAALAWRAGKAISVRQCLADMAQLAERLPDAPFMLNGCADRYHFVVAMGAALTRGQISVLPNNLLPRTLTQLSGQFHGVYGLVDDETQLGPMKRIAYPHEPARPGSHDVPAFPADQTAAFLFTSGSTGDPVGHRRSWGTIVASARAEAQRLGLAPASSWTILGTVPSQHSYGFESAVHLALQSGSALVAERPFFPQDVVDALARLSGPRLLVTTPVHLRALMSVSVTPHLAQLVLSATAPMPRELSDSVEARFQVPLLEIYGSTESGQLASRRPTLSDAWEPLDGVEVGVEGERGFAQGGYVGDRVALSDRLELAEAGRFLLKGRIADMVNIAGKRSSIAFLEHQLLSVDGVLDAACWIPADDGRDTPARVCAFAVAPGLDERQILTALRERVDAAFLPRPLILLDTLPRDATGKLPRERLEALVTDALKARANARHERS